MRTIARCLATTSLVLVTAAFASPSWAADVDATSAIDTVTVYPDGATVTRVMTIDLASGDSTLVAKDFPLSLDPSSLRVEGEAGAKLTIGTIDARPPRAAAPVNLPELDKRIEALKDQRADLQGAIDAANARRKFAQHFAEASPAGLGDKGEARPITEWRAAFAAVAEEVATADTAIRDAFRKQREIDRQIAQLEADRSAKPPSKLEVRIDVASTAATKAMLRVTYTVRNAPWLPLYDARLDTGGKDRKPQLELVRRAEVTQSTGEDWSNVTLGVSTVRIARGGSAPELGSLVAQYPQQVPKPQMDMLIQSRSRSAVASAPVAEPAQDKTQEFRFGGGTIIGEQEATAEIGDFQATFKIPGRVSLGAAEGAKSLRIASMSVPADLAVRAAPVQDPTAFLEASFKQTDDTALLPGKVAIYRDGVFVGRGKLSASAKDDIVRLGFGADDKVKVERAVLKRNEGSAGLLVTTSKTDERAFKTTIRNGHDFPIRVAIEDQLPVSEVEDIVVEMLPATTPPTAKDIRDKRGVLEWSFDAKPGEVRDINFAWRVRWPKDKNMVIVPSG
ncbi:mucoidy inhibitor MuiA family protein [Bradyrhizobium sp. INPA01-394B]|uniref:Mucoidy inhibitor MuiA family protein n=1 Tax=Bradyrhizobium campsiandrae TaxID=1729892 RepID=A0ABR7UDH6_9BRAD|nr:mucoidy inhibitor MuiA family protein [Bradyrhizobium campsiandrae]MBC9881431.1 mucoidy inhibitor MuiA family protein [Bradyrhizobium campsiandrae]MBC9981462.1 mucoidy inhibitor MuiA family protein [Bradyrhizobium campsiandrae]